METIAGPVFRFSTRRAVAFSHGFDVVRIGTGSLHRSDVSSNIPVYTGSRIFLGRWSCRRALSVAKPRLNLVLAAQSQSGFHRGEKTVLIYHFPEIPSVLPWKNYNKERNESSGYFIAGSATLLVPRARGTLLFFSARQCTPDARATIDSRQSDLLD